MRYILSCLFAGAVGLLTSQSSDLHSRFGEPTAETFNVGPGISLTVQYGSDRLVCQALIDPPQPLLHGEEEVPNMSSEEVSKSSKKSRPRKFAAKNSAESSATAAATSLRLSNTRTSWLRVQVTTAFLSNQTARCEQLFRLSVLRAPAWQRSEIRLTARSNRRAEGTGTHFSG